MNAVCMTTIRPPTEQVKKWVDWCSNNNWVLCVSGDEKTDDQAWLDYSQDRQYIHYVGIPDQAMSWPKLAELIPRNHYARKIFAYLAAMRAGADQIFDTDDDNAPLSRYTGPIWEGALENAVDILTMKQGGWFNIFEWFLLSGQRCWPRGFPLEANKNYIDRVAESSVYSYVKQFMCDGEPDVDAVQRLVNGMHDRAFQDRRTAALRWDTWCPINSQSTLFLREAFPLLYLPVECTFRATDILRGYVIQRAAWAMGHQVTYHRPFVYQKRNEHNLLRDFEQEIPLYLHAEECRRALMEPIADGAKLHEIMTACYQRLQSVGGVLGNMTSDLEDRCLEEWLKVCEKVSEQPPF